MLTINRWWLLGLGAVAMTLSQTGIVLAKEPQARCISQPQNHEARCEPIGGLFTEQGQAFVLQKTDVKARVTGNISRVEVTQTFKNPFPEALEATYVFPLPDEAAIDEMEIRIGSRIIRGTIKKRAEAKRLYEEAKQQGRTTGLLEQERDNIFTQSLANIRPGESIQVKIRYSDSLKFEKGQYEFVFPMVVGPRYIPTGLGDAARISPKIVPPNTRSGQDIDVSLEIAAGVPITEVRSTSHQIQLQAEGESTLIVLADNDRVPNKDFIVRYRVSDTRLQSTVLTQTDSRGGHLALYLIPALQYAKQEIVAKDVVFLMDTSGSQAGDPLLKSQELMRRFINGLNPQDTFTIINFADTTEVLSATPLSNTPRNRQLALNYINKLQANGGTELLNGIKRVLQFPTADSGRVRSIVLLTDGYIGNDQQVLAEVQKELEPGNRLYVFGVGSSVNRFLLNRLGEIGWGTTQIVRQDEPTAAVAEQFFQNINNPVLTNIQVRWQGSGEALQLYPQRVPDLFANQPLVLFGRKRDRLGGTLTIRGTTAGGGTYQKSLKVDFSENTSPAISQLWGRARIKDLMNQLYGNETESGVAQVTQTALDYRLLSQYTAFIALSEEVRVSPNGERRRVQVPVEMPEGVEYEGIFGAAESPSAPTSARSVTQFNRSRAIPKSSAIPAPSPPPRFKNNQPTIADRAGGQGTGMGESSDQFQSSEPTSRRQDASLKKEEKDKAVPTGRISVLTAPGVDAATLAQLNQLLRAISSTTQGTLVFEFPMGRGRVGWVRWDESTSTLKDRDLADKIRALLARWTPPSRLQGKIRLTLIAR